MKISTKPRHWIALVVALATTVVAIISFADFSGDPAPRWREIALLAGVLLTAAANLVNFIADRRGGASGD